jgi:hypothetical protein
MNTQALAQKKGRVTANHNQTIVAPVPDVWPNHNQTVRIAR